MNKYYDKYLKYKKKYLNLHSQLAGAGSFNSPTRAGLFNSPTRAGSFNSPTRAGLFNSLSTGSFNSPPAGSFNSPPAGSFNSPPAGSFNSPPAGSFNSPPAGSFNAPPAGSFNSPPAGSFNSPQAGSFNSPPASPKSRKLPSASLNLSTPPASPNLRNQNTIKTDLRSKDEINNEIIQLVNISYRNDWLLTGSLAIIKYQKALGISSGLVANDVDILKICEGHLKFINEKKIDRYIRVQQTHEKSVTFSNGKNSFDVTCISKLPTHNIINGIRVLSPKILLDYYNDDNRPQDKEKINILKQIISIIEQGYTVFKL